MYICVLYARYTGTVHAHQYEQHAMRTHAPEIFLCMCVQPTTSTTPSPQGVLHEWRKEVRGVRGSHYWFSVMFAERTAGRSFTSTPFWTLTISDLQAQVLMCGCALSVMC